MLKNKKRNFHPGIHIMLVPAVKMRMLHASSLLLWLRFACLQKFALQMQLLIIWLLYILTMLQR